MANESPLQTTQTGLADLPGEILALVLSCLPGPALVRIGATSTSLLKLTRSEELDESLWGRKLPAYCVEASLQLEVSKQRESSVHAGSEEAPRKTHRELSCLVHSFVATLPDMRTAEEAMRQASICWDAGRLLHADVILAFACSNCPSLPVFAAYTSLLLHENNSLERTAHVLISAGQHIHTSNLLAKIHRAVPPWRQGLDPDAGVNDLHASSRQLACLIAMLLRLENYTLAALQAALRPKHRVLCLGTVPAVFEEWLGAPLREAPDPTEPAPASPDPEPRLEQEASSDAAAPEGAALPCVAQAPAASEAAVSGSTGQPAASLDLSEPPGGFLFLGNEYRWSDLAAARRLLLKECSPLAERSDAALLASSLPLTELRGDLAELLGDLVVRPVTRLNDMFCNFLWNERARAHVSEAFEGASSHFLCKRMSAWAAVDCYLSAVTLLKAKPSNNYRLLVGPGNAAPLAENMQASCLSELTLELQQLGWTDAAKHCCIWAMVENEAGGASDIARCRFELAGTLVDTYAFSLEKSRSTSSEEVAATVKEAIIWTLASAKLTPDGHSMMNAAFVNRLSKVLHCCVLRLPDWRHKERCAKAALALCRLGLRMYRGEHTQPCDQMPVPLVNFAPFAARSAGQSGTARPGSADAPRPKWLEVGVSAPRPSQHQSAGPQPFALLAEWHQHFACEELTAMLREDDITDIIGTEADLSAPASSSASTSRLPKSLVTMIGRFSGMWSRKPAPGTDADARGASRARAPGKHGPRHAAQGSVPADAGVAGLQACGRGGQEVVDVSHLCDWMGEMLYLNEECAWSEVWEDYEEELAELLGMEGGSEELQALLRDARVPEDNSSLHWESICHIYEHMAHTCTAMSRTSMSGLFYGMSAKALMHLPPQQTLHDGLDGPHVPTAASFMTDILSQQATELTAAGELPAAMASLQLCETVCKQQLQHQRTHVGTRLTEPLAARAMLARVKVQMASTLMELHNRHGVAEVAVPLMRWPLAHHLTVLTGRTVSVPVSYDAAREHVHQALAMSRDRYLDGHLQGLFVLGDLALVTYDLEEGRRVFSLVAVASSHAIVQHYNLMLQAQAFRAVAEMHVGNVRSAHTLIARCIETFGLEAHAVAHADPALDTALSLFVRAMTRLVEDCPSPAASPCPSHAPPSAGAQRASAGPHRTRSAAQQRGGPAHQAGSASQLAWHTLSGASEPWRQAPTGGAAAGPGHDAPVREASRGGSADGGPSCGSQAAPRRSQASQACEPRDAPAGAPGPLERACMAAEAAAGPSSAEPAQAAAATAAAAGGNAAGSAEAGGAPAAVRGARRRGSRLGQLPMPELVFEDVSAEDVEQAAHQDLLMRLMAAAAHRNMSQFAVIESLRLRVMELLIQGVGEAEAEEAVERMHGHDLQGPPPDVHLRAVRDMALQLERLPTSASGRAWINAMIQNNLLHGIQDVMGMGEAGPDLADLFGGDLPGGGGGSSAGASDADDSEHEYGSDSAEGDDEAELELWEYLRVAEQPGASIEPPFECSRALAHVTTDPIAPAATASPSSAAHERDTAATATPSTTPGLGPAVESGSDAAHARAADLSTHSHAGPCTAPVSEASPAAGSASEAPRAASSSSGEHSSASRSSQGAAGAAAAAASAWADPVAAAAASTITEEMLEIEDAEWSAIQAFMNQVGLQLHLMHGQHEEASDEAVQSMRIKSYDQHSYVHIWYWSGTIAQHRGDWLHACLYFRRAVRCTQRCRHLSMQAKCLTAACEAVLGCAVAAHAPQLSNTGFAALRPHGGSARARRAALCRDLHAALVQRDTAARDATAPQPTGSSAGGADDAPGQPRGGLAGTVGAAEEHAPDGSSTGGCTCGAVSRDARRAGGLLAQGWTWAREETWLKLSVRHALRNTAATSDEGVELRTLLVALFVLEMEGLLTYNEDGSLACEPARPVSWLLNTPVGALVDRAHVLGCRLRRNVMVVRRLMACRVALDPEAIWQVDAMCDAEGTFAMLKL